MKKFTASFVGMTLALHAGLCSAGLLDILFGEPAKEDLSGIHCPDVELIKHQGIGEMSFNHYGYAPIMAGSFTATTYSTYGTVSAWYFEIGNINAKNRQEAYDLATAALSTLSGKPDYQDGCIYSISGKGKSGYPLSAIARLGD